MSILRLCASWFLLNSLSVMAIETLTVYTHSSFTAAWGPGPEIKKAFEAQCHCRVAFVTLGGSCAILSRLQLEAKNSRFGTRADVVIGLDNSLLMNARQSALFTPHNVDTSQLALPGGWHDRYFVPYAYSYPTLIYNDRLLANPPRSLKELVENPLPWRVIYADPRTSGLGFNFLRWIQAVYGQESASAWRKLAQKTVAVTGNWSEAYGLFLRGEADLVLGYTTSPLYHQYAKKDQRYRAALFTEGHMVQVEVAAKLASSQHQLLADQFMQFMLSPWVQTLLLTTHWVYPAVAVVLPEPFLHLPRPSIFLAPNEPVTVQDRQQWISTWRRAVVKH